LAHQAFSVPPGKELYLEKLLNTKMLGFYPRCFPITEINYAFRRLAGTDPRNRAKRNRSHLFQHRLQHLPHIVSHDALAFGGGMNAVWQVESRFSTDSFEQERDEIRAILLG